MRTFHDAASDVNHDLTDQDIDRLLAGESPVSQDHAPVVLLVSALATFGDITLRETLVDEYSKLAARMVRESRPAQTTETASTRIHHFVFGLKRRAVAGLTALMMISGMTGVAWASDGAVPGDWNYGIPGAGGCRDRKRRCPRTVT